MVAELLSDIDLSQSAVGDGARRNTASAECRYVYSGITMQTPDDRMEDAAARRARIVAQRKLETGFDEAVIDRLVNVPEAGSSREKFPRAATRCVFVVNDVLTRQHEVFVKFEARIREVPGL